jgi:hypothetical protein
MPRRPGPGLSCCWASRPAGRWTAPGAVLAGSVLWGLDRPAAADHALAPVRTPLGPVEWILIGGAVLALLLAAWALLAPRREGSAERRPGPPRAS